MKRRLKYPAAALLALLLALALGGCTQSASKVEEEKDASFYANMYSYNGVTQCAEQVFYIEQGEDTLSLNVRKAGGEHGTQIAEDITRYFVTDNYIFFETSAGDGFYRMDHAGKHKTKVSEELPAELVAMGSSVYFTTYQKENPENLGGLYQAAADGTDAVLVADMNRAYNLFPYEGTLYFCLAVAEDEEVQVELENGWVGMVSDGVYPMNGTIYTYDPAVENATAVPLLGAQHVKRFLIADGQIFWVGLQLWSMELDGEESVLCGDPHMLVDGNVLNFNQNALYYSANYDRVDRYDLTSHTATAVLEQPKSAIWVAENTVYCADAQSGDVTTLS